MDSTDHEESNWRKACRTLRAEGTHVKASDTNGSRPEPDATVMPSGDTVTKVQIGGSSR
jgi:hypothetical protein